MLALIIIFAGYSTIDIYNPWNGMHSGFIGAERSVPAQNFLKYGFLKTRFGAVAERLPDSSDGSPNFKYNIHHPPGMSYLITISFMAFGEHEWSARLVPIVANIVTIIFLYLFAAEMWDRRLAVLASGFMVFSPMFFYIRYFTELKTLYITATFVILYFYARWLKTGGDVYLHLSLLSFAVGTLSDWPIYFIVPVLVIHGLFFSGKLKARTRRKILLFVPLALLTFLLYLSYAWILTGTVTANQARGDDLINMLKFRTGFYDGRGISSIIYTVGREMKARIERFYTPFSIYAIIILTIYSACLAFKKDDELRRMALPAMMLLSLTAHFLIFNNLFMNHDFYVMVLMPAMPLLMALAVKYSWDFLSSRLSSGRASSRVLFGALLAAVFLLFFSTSYSTCLGIVNENRNYWPFAKFLSGNGGNVIMPHDSGQYNWYPALYYINERTLRNAETKAEFYALISDPEEDFKYYIYSTVAPPSQELSDYLALTYNRTVVRNTKDRSYIIYSIQ